MLSKLIKQALKGFKKPMILKVVRYRHLKDRTIGKLYINDVFECYTLEDAEREVKVWGETCIPLGTYELKLRQEGSFNIRYTKKFPDFHKGMLHVTNVDNFKYILIHIGNFIKDTAGCLLVGKEVNELENLSRSTDAYKQMYQKVIKGFENGQKVYITYENE